MTTDDRIDRVIAALEAADAPTPRPPETDEALLDLEAELAPLRLPSGLRRLWQRVDPATMVLRTFPQLSDPGFALSGWRMNRDDEFGLPLNLLAYCYESHFHLLAELDDGEQPGGAVFAFAFADDTLTLRFADVDDWLDVLAVIVEEGAYQRSENEHGTWLWASKERFDALVGERLAAAGPHALYGDSPPGSVDPSAWPERWHRVTEPYRRAREPRGADLTVRELLAATREGEVRATLAGVQTHIAIGTPGEPWRILFADETGILDVLCPGAVTGLGLLGHAARVELDVRAARVSGPRAIVDWRGFGPVRLHDLVLRMDPQAIAEAIRPLPEDR